MRVTSPQNPRIKALVRLRERRVREREGRFVLEGAREINRAMQAGVSLQELYICPELFSDEAQRLFARLTPARVTLIELSPEVFAKASYRDGPDGLLAVAPIQRRSLAELELPPDALLLVVDGLEKPGNLGALLRTADGAGLDAVFVTGEGTDLYNPNVIRASMGSVFSRPVLEVSAETLVPWLTRRGYQLVAASPVAPETYWEADYRPGTALILGAEHAGLSALWQRAATMRVSIPMRGLSDSLNVATAGALLVYEALRQRRA